MARSDAGGPSCPAALDYLRRAIAETTRKSYDTAIARFRLWRTNRNTLPDLLPTADEICTWGAELGSSGGLAASTVKAYVSALGEWFVQNVHPDSQLPNPTGSAAVRRMLDGITRAKAEQALLGGRPLVAPAKPLLYTTLQQYFFTDAPRDRMLRAAAYLGVAGGFRPGELFTSKSGRPLKRKEMVFWADTMASVRIHPPHTGVEPRSIQVMLRATKTKQNGPTCRFIRAPDAVRACWRWFCDTADREPDAIFFQEKEGGPALSPMALTADLNRRNAAAGLGPAYFTGKSLRQGGASTLAILGVDQASMAALGWAPGSLMAEHYARGDPEAVRQMALHRAGHMQPLPPAQPEHMRSGAGAAGRC